MYFNVFMELFRSPKLEEGSSKKIYYAQLTLLLANFMSETTDWVDRLAK